MDVGAVKAPSPEPVSAGARARYDVYVQYRPADLHIIRNIDKKVTGYSGCLT
jgi:hypothetical protein